MFNSYLRLFRASCLPRVCTFARYWQSCRNILLPMIRTYMPVKSPRHFIVRAELRNTHRASASVVPQIPRGAHATISATTRSPARHVRESGSEHLDHAQIAQALDFWKQSRFKEAELVFGTFASRSSLVATFQDFLPSTDARN